MEVRQFVDIVVAYRVLTALATRPNPTTLAIP